MASYDEARRGPMPPLNPSTKVFQFKRRLDSEEAREFIVKHLFGEVATYKCEMGELKETMNGKATRRQTSND